MPGISVRPWVHSQRQSNLQCLLFGRQTVYLKPDSLPLLHCSHAAFPFSEQENLQTLQRDLSLKHSALEGVMVHLPGLSGGWDLESL